MFKKSLVVALIPVSLIFCGDVWAAKVTLKNPNAPKPSNGPNVGKGEHIPSHTPARPILPEAASATAEEHLQAGVCKKLSASAC